MGKSGQKPTIDARPNIGTFHRKVLEAILVKKNLASLLVTFLVRLSDPFKSLSDLQGLGMKRSLPESPGILCICM